MVQVQLPLDSGLAGVIATNLGNIAKLTLEFSSAKAGGSANNTSAGGQQSFGFSGPTAEPAPEDETHQAGEERIASTCPACGGTSYVGEGSEEACDTCGGTGVVYTSPGPALAMITCEACEGSGNVADEEGALGPCVACHGTGKVEAEVTDDPVGDAAAEYEEGDEHEEPVKESA